jgi:hypothetical protein
MKQEGKNFFFEKKKQKNFGPLRAALGGLRPNAARRGEKVFARFFQKALLSFCSP